MKRFEKCAGSLDFTTLYFFSNNADQPLLNSWQEGSSEELPGWKQASAGVTILAHLLSLTQITCGYSYACDFHCCVQVLHPMPSFDCSFKNI